MEQFSTKYGHFSADGNEYIIANYRTPKPWVNVISNGKYGLVISQIGGGFSWDTHSEFNRLNRWHQDLVQDNWGKYFYVKDNITGDVWSPTWMPVKTELDSYQVAYGFGYAKFTSEYKGIKIALTVFIPIDENIEVWNFEIENKSSQKKSLSIFSYFEWCLGSSSDHHREFHKTFLETHFDTKLNCMTATKRLWEIPLGDRGHWNIEYPYLGFISCSKKISDYDGNKDTFIGQYGSLQNPAGLSAKGLSKSIGKWNDSIASVKTKIEIKPNEKENVNFFMGIKEDKKAIAASLKKFNNQKNIDSALFDLKLFWHKMFDTLVIETPDKAMNLMVNKWLRYQSIAGRLWGRTAYYQQSGAFGFRDQLQDSMVFLPIDPKKTEDQIRLHAKHQFEDGTVLHWWHPISETGLPTKMTDDLLWLPFVLMNYIEETGNYKILSAKEHYYDNKNKKDSLFEHSVAAIEKVLTRLSNRGLTLIGAGDWNDGLSAVGLEMKGESIWLTEFFYLILTKFSDLCKDIGKDSLHKKYSKKAIELKKAFNKYAWDGDWFWRATKDDGNTVGSKTSPEGKIYLNAQTWSVISGIAESDKQKKAMDSVSKHLLKNNGCLLLSPAYTKPDKMIGYLSRYAPGRRENGGVYTHAATWAVWAYSLLKDREQAFKSYKNLCPVYSGMNPDDYVAEPYVTPGNIDGPDSPNYGMGGWTWYTGSAAWYQKVIVDWILGIRASKGGLVVDPCVPDYWKEFSVKRLYRGTTYNILVIQTSKSNKQKKHISVDGEKIEGNILPLSKNKEVKVEVYI
ncbi:MAG: glycosyl transferase family 36 [Ignavibacteriales bacterium]|nr:glycosyl transferase family 36 [Ignavibacteriales bacterium]